jgi:hypothetical protein
VEITKEATAFDTAGKYSAKQKKRGELYTQVSSNNSFDQDFLDRTLIASHFVYRKEKAPSIHPSEISRSILPPQTKKGLTRSRQSVCYTQPKGKTGT